MISGKELGSALSRVVIEHFCDQCDWAHEVWLNHRQLFDDNPHRDELAKSFAGHELERLSIISHEYSLLQIRKLHDKAIMNKSATLGIDYIIEFGGWSEPVLSDLKDMANKLGAFAQQLTGARNKVLAHNDLAAILASVALGGFKEDEDLKYFEVLQDFVNIVYGQVIGGIRPFNTIVRNDVAAFLEVLSNK